MIGEQLDKPLTNHPRGTKHDSPQLIHTYSTPAHAPKHHELKSLTRSTRPFQKALSNPQIAVILIKHPPEKLFI
jgi:hypothetical protein